MRVRFAALLAAILALSAPSFAQARWLRAESPRFVVYSDGGEAELKQYTAKLEVFDAMLRVLHGLPMDALPPRKLDLYLVANASGIRRVAPGIKAEIAGFYSAGPGAIFAIGRRDVHDDYVVLHEYTHHFMMQYFPYPYPSWLVEGYAEYFDTTKIDSQYVDVGAYGDRAVSMLYEKWLPVEKLLTARVPDVPDDDMNAYYGESWILTHYFMSDPGRYKQLQSYMRAVADGGDPREAMERITGMSATALERKMQAYLHGGIKYRRLNRSAFKDPPITVTALPPSADAILLETLQVTYRAYDGYDDDGDKATPDQAREKRAANQAALLKVFAAAAARYPGDRLAQLGSARAQISFGDRAAGEAAAQAWLAEHPLDTEALQLLARSRMAAADADAEHAQGLYREAGAFLAKAYKADNADYRTLFAYARTRSVEADYPTDNTLTILREAHGLAPQVSEITLVTASALIARGRDADAATLLRPLAAQPHGGGGAKAAKAMLDGIAARAKPSASENR